MFKIMSISDRHGTIAAVGERMTGKETIVTAITDNTHWITEEGWSGGIPSFSLDFSDGTRVGMYTGETVFYDMKNED